VELFFKYLPVLFGGFFLGPVTAEILTRSSVIDHLASPSSQVDVEQIALGLSLMQLCMIVGAVWGLLAVFRGRWI
jgi:predicted histidine transporter YuiF (NhaC family)